jgi:hypothetical protein
MTMYTIERSNDERTRNDGWTNIAFANSRDARAARGDRALRVACDVIITAVRVRMLEASADFVFLLG